MRKNYAGSLLLVMLLIFCRPDFLLAKNIDKIEAKDHPALKNPSALFSERFFYECKPATFTTATPEGRLTVETTLDAALQQRLMTLFSRSGPMISAAVVLDAKTGAVLAMGNSTSRGGASLLPKGAENYCLYGGFPAASLAKIITASVGLEKGFDTSHLVPVSGRYHTLYRSQLGIKRSPYKPEMVPLKKAFALSINPYFGKMWIDSFTDREFLDLSRELLFNMPLEFDLPVIKSRIVAPKNAFERAEVASGYNTRTTISPLHAALIAALPANGGRMLRPYVIDRIADKNGKTIYRHMTKTLAQPLSPRSVSQLGKLMQATVESGTARGSFKNLKNIGKANGWTMGGKTGSISLPERTGRCDWFAGFGKSAQTSVAVACILVHGPQRTMRSSAVAAEMIRASLDPTGVHKLPAVKYVKKSSGSKKKPTVAVTKKRKKQAGRKTAAVSKAKPSVRYRSSGG